MPQQPHFRSAGLALIASAFLLVVGCGRSTSSSATSRSASAQKTVNDGQLATEVKAQLQADAALSTLPIQTHVSNGIVTLSGQVSDQAARELAANDAAQVSGIRTVVNNLTVQTGSATATPVQPHAMHQASDAAAERRAAAVKREEAQNRREQQREQAQQTRRQQQRETSQQVVNNAPPAAANPTLQSQLQQPAPPPVKAPAPPPQPPKPVTETITIPPGTDFPVRISESLETGKVQTGDQFHGALADNLVINGQTALRRGASVTGVVTDAKDAARFRGRSELSLELQRVKTANKALPVSTEALVRQGKARGKDTALKAGGGALFGTLLGALAGGGRGALMGAAAGGAAGTGANAITRGQQVQIPSESILHFKLNQPLTVTITRTPGSSPVTSYNSSDTPQLQQPQQP
ncbi:MAG TPA: BON domain-containing protein [Acidobacteriaceae bacterium]|nr:BON domain-containing protein [Acidobacteriaceae bacterium]